MLMQSNQWPHGHAYDFVPNRVALRGRKHREDLYSLHFGATFQRSASQQTVNLNDSAAKKAAKFEHEIAPEFEDILTTGSTASDIPDVMSIFDFSY